MCKSFLRDTSALHCPCLPLTRPTRLRRQYFFPSFVGLLLYTTAFLCLLSQTATIQACGRGLIPIKMGSIDFYSLDYTHTAELDHDPIELLCVVPSCLPAIVPSPSVNVDARLANSRRRRQKVGGRCKVLVAEREDVGAEDGCTKICGCREGAVD